MSQNRAYRHTQYDAQDRLISYGNTEFQYNANGDLTAKIQRRNDINEDFDDHSFWGGIFYRLDKNDTRQTQYTYDVFGNLKSVILPDGKNIDYIIDGQNRRVGKKVNGKLVHGYIYQSQTQIAAEIDGKGNITKQFIYGEKANIPDYMIMNGKEYRIISNQVGTPELIVEVSSGKVIEELNFDEFGIPRNRLERSIIPFGFAGGIYDHDTGLVRFGARDYDPVVGRWTTKDSLGFNSPGTNLYSYSLQDPINLIDYNGKNPAVIGGLIVGGIVGGIGGFINAPSGCGASGALAGAVSGAIGGAVAGLTGGATTFLGTLGGIGFDFGAAAIGQAIAGSCPSQPPAPPHPASPPAPGSSSGSSGGSGSSGSGGSGC